MSYIEFLIDENLFQSMQEDDIFNGMVSNYLGTCDSFDDEDREWLERHLREEDWELEIYRCSQCAWWVESCERKESPNGEDVCEDCYEENK